MSIGSKRASHLLFVAYYGAKEENKAKTRVILKEASEVDINDNYICSLLEDSNFNKYGFFSKNEDDNHWENIPDGSQKHI